MGPCFGEGQNFPSGKPLRSRTSAGQAVRKFGHKGNLFPRLCKARDDLLSAPSGRPSGGVKRRIVRRKSGPILPVSGESRHLPPLRRQQNPPIRRGLRGNRRPHRRHVPRADRPHAAGKRNGTENFTTSRRRIRPTFRKRHSGDTAGPLLRNRAGLPSKTAEPQGARPEKASQRFSSPRPSDDGRCSGRPFARSARAVFRL